MGETTKFIAIGDIHGCLKSLKKLMHSLQESTVDFEERCIVFIGDYIDRGPESAQVLDYLISINHDLNCIFLRGNHDQMMLDAIERDDWKLWLFNGGESTLNSYGASTLNFNPPENHVEFLKNTRLYFESREYIFVHGGFDPVLSIRENIETKDPHLFMWMREHIHASWNNWEKTVVFGHTPTLNPIQKKNMIGIDTGCVYAKQGMGKLTAVLLPEEKFIQQQFIDN